MGTTDIKSMDLRLGGNPFPTAQQRLQEASTSFSLPIPSPSKLNRPSQPQPYQFPSSHPTLSGSNITEFDLAANAALQAANHSRQSLTSGDSPLKRTLSYSGVPTSHPQQSSQQPPQSNFSIPAPYNANTQFHLAATASYPLAPLSENIDHVRLQSEKRDSKTPKRASLQPPAPIQRSFSQPLFPISKDASPSKTTSSPIDMSGDIEFEPIIDDGAKPPYSYAHLIGMAILRSPQRRLTLNQIYTWIMTTFDYYRAEAQPQTNWQNSIRHNLSLNKAFIKEERPKDEPGKGHYWKIVPGAEAQFAKGAKGRRPINQHRNSTGGMPPPVLTAVQPPPQLASAASFTYHAMTSAPSAPNLNLEDHEPRRRHRISSISSDEGEPEHKRSHRNSNVTSHLPTFDLEPPIDPMLKIAPPQRLEASPILPPSMDTPPPSQDAKGSRKRKSFRDSGYFSTPDPNDTTSASFDTTNILMPPPHTDDDSIIVMDLSYADTSSTNTKRPRLDAALSESRIIAKPPPPSFHNLSIISPPPSSSPQRGPLSTRKVLFTTPRAQISRRLQEAPPSTCSPQTRLQLHREDINRYLSSPAKSVIFENSFDDPYLLEWENSPGKNATPATFVGGDSGDDVVLRYAYGSPARREVKRRNYWRRQVSGFDPADIDGEGENDATEVYGVDLGYIYRSTLQKKTEAEEDKAETGQEEEDDDADEDEDEDYKEEENETESEDSSEDGEGVLGSPEWGKEHEEAFNELSPP